MEWMLLPLKRYADFSGRSRRMEYWMFALFVVLITMALILMMGGLSGDSLDGSAGFGTSFILLMLFSLGIFIPSLAVQVRRLHDQDRSGWWVLINFIPYVGSLVILVFMLLDGTHGENRFGPDPKGREGRGPFERTGVSIR